jgi:hypothetical protein
VAVTLALWALKAAGGGSVYEERGLLVLSLED